MKKLEGKVSLVTGGTKNVGKGIALGLGEAGATVYVTGRSIKEKDVKGITAAGGKGIAVACNHKNDDEVQSVFKLIKKNEGKIDVLVNNAWGGYNRLRNRKAYSGFKWKDPFWKQPIELWEEMNSVGVRSNYVASVYATQIMLKRRQGLIVNISFYASLKYYGNVIYGVTKASVDKMTMDMSVELKKSNIACVSLYPGYIADKRKTPNPKKESAQFVGRAISALASDPEIMKRTGQILVAAELAREYGFTDIDGTQPKPFDTL
ncbi:MAG: SDR family NAD(P)-dependent oxidoreductase [Ignavibacteria bacterium]|nr:SDR family NAD(P)-dependent oxidoreductase [Ignavibacteria bacterium]MBT8383812.1 SDR family NAD(P)-dependent oxidoreductase [Ignavibacteria bacterium]MBT8391585.1 SDR family NAD(P)-dependent oxidoreductase [Ignavibacteria bacterium]NNJ53718.1 SDR family NAD(P)-dependent oxidoreductase [Ignavibacteriaceae bacterium]NNL20782.1 SDR family NAD(P)-dependent oxidoreductase [Ignavibacteriaceae bacterium]